ncbi:phosphatase 2C-like domain-containing protein [Crassisporium funariophilum]|nr:phosphatase 2C-like domain-containing protein [Crassisporium funariophilum]
MEDVVGQIITPTADIPTGLAIHIAQFQPTDRPIEDRLSLNLDVNSNRLILGVYDGHGGSETADHISQRLPPLLLENAPTDHTQVFERLDSAILSAFKRDHSLFRSKSSDWIHNAQLIKSGSTALILDVDLTKMVATYANAGDCRLVICNSNPGERQTLRQTEDLNMKTPSERERLMREHPNEDQFIVSDRLFGRLMCTRGFGDGYYKLPKGLLGDGQHRRYIDTLSSIERRGKIPMNAQYANLFYGYRTPPYLTATPATGEYQLRTGDIVIMATDGLWDLVSSETAVDIVLQGVATQKHDLARYLLEQVKAEKSPGDDVTVLIFLT